MGKGRIISAHGEGRYTIELVEDRARAEQVKNRSAEVIAALDDAIIKNEELLAVAQGIVDLAVADQDDAIRRYQETLTDDQEPGVDLAAFAEQVLDAAGQRDKIKSYTAKLRLDRLSFQMRINNIDALPPLRQINAWCADYTEGLAGDVATAEIPGEAAAVQVRPGYAGGAMYNPSRDGALQPVMSSTPAAAFYNLAMLPGWQRWRPIYRHGSVASIDRDTGTCSLTLDTAFSSAQGVGVNPQASYSDVAFRYMTCDEDAFEVGDKVLVEFAAGQGAQPGVPTVVGFVEYPRACTCCVPRVLVAAKYAQLVTPAEHDILTTGFVIEDAGEQARIRRAGDAGAAGDVLGAVYDSEGKLIRCKGALPEQYRFLAFDVPGGASISETIVDTIESYSNSMVGQIRTVPLGTGPAYGRWQLQARYADIENQPGGLPLYLVERNANGDVVLGDFPEGEIGANGSPIAGEAIEVITDDYGSGYAINFVFMTNPAWCMGAEIGCQNPETGDMTWP